MEELEVYYRMSMELLPEYLRPYVDFKLSPRVEDYYCLFRGVRYQVVPDRPYDFIFIDGPELNAPSDGTMTFDFDYLSIILRSETPIFGIIDYRLSTSFVYQTILGLNKVKFDAIRELAFVGPCTKHDVQPLELESLTDTLVRNARLIGNTEIKLS